MIPISLRYYLILSPVYTLGLARGLFQVGYPVKILKALLSRSILATCPAHLNFLDLITLTALGVIKYKEIETDILIIAIKLFRL